MAPARHRPGILRAAARPSAPIAGRSSAMYHSSARPAQTGKNARQENFDRIARPPATPNHTAFRGVGLSVHASAARNVAPRNAVSAISVVASPACASTGGRKLKKNTATAAAAGPK